MIAFATDRPAGSHPRPAPFGHDGKLSADEKRKAKRSVLDAWPGP